MEILSGCIVSQHVVTNNVKMHKQRARRDLNPRPTEPESVALSTELRALNLRYYSTSVIEFAL